MAPKSTNKLEFSQLSELQSALRTANLELSLARSTPSVESVAKDEELRQCKMQIVLLEDENDELHEQLKDEESRVDSLEQSLNDALTQLEQGNLDFQQASNDLRIKTREAENLKAEVGAMQTVSSDSAKLLTEKLALSRELATLKPEVEHLRAQVASQNGLMAEKLSLQRQLSTIQVEFENEKRATNRAQAREERVTQLEADYRSQTEDVQKDLARERREHEKTAKALAKAESQLTKAESQLTTEARERKDAEKALERAESDLEKEKRAVKAAVVKQAKNSEEDAATEARLDELRKDASKERKERERAEKALKQSQMEWEARASALEEKVGAFRTKLKTTKEQLKERDLELEKAKTASVVTSNAIPTKTDKNSRKRAAFSVDPDVAIGTPGDGKPAKRTKRASSTAPGEKSTFSITPFLNRTANIAPDSPEDVEDASKDDDDAIDLVEEPDATPSAQPTKTVKVTAKKPLATATNKSNVKTAPKSRKKAAPVPTLEKVTEEATEDDNSRQDINNNQENQTAAPTAATTTTKPTAMVPKFKPKPALLNRPVQARKSLASFPTFSNEDSTMLLDKKKKRKLLGGGKTLFDEAEEEAAPPKPIPGKGLFAARALGKGAGSIFAGKNAIKAGFMMTDDGFQFSPLKKDRRAAASLK